MLLRARVVGLGLCSELATATARWQLLGSAGCVAEWREHQREATGGGGGPERRVGASAKQEAAQG